MGLPPPAANCCIENDIEPFEQAVDRCKACVLGATVQRFLEVSRMLTILQWSRSQKNRSIFSPWQSGEGKESWKRHCKHSEVEA